MRNFTFAIRSRLLLVLMLFTALQLSAQRNSNSYELYMEPAVQTPAANLNAFIAGPEPTDGFNGIYYRLVQFNAIPTQAQRAQIEQSGIRLLDYIPNFAYLTAIPVGYNRAKLSQFNVRSVMQLTPLHKVRPNLRDEPLPYWCVNQPGKLDVAVTLYRGVDEAAAKAVFYLNGFEALSENEFDGAVILRIDQSRLDDLAALPFVYFVEPISPPAEPENYTGRSLHRSNVIASDHALGRHYDGSGVIVAMGDDGPIGPHIDYQGRTDQSRVSTNDGNHGDHVAGTIMGAGNLDPEGRGMAFGADLFVYSVWDAVNDSDTDHDLYGVMITSTSYSNGCNAGYTSFARNADRSTYDNPSLLHVFSAGNDGTSDCGYGAGANWGNVTGGVKVGKNVIAVGNVSANDGLANSSSRGPAADGRIKPEICAKGSSVISTIDENTYANFSGTSMACPGVSGTSAQLYHAYRSLNGNADPDAALIRGVLMNTADDIGNAGPDFKHGYGRMNALRAVQTLENGWHMADSVAQGGSNSHQITVPAGTAELRVMICWTDFEGSVGATVALTNDLNMTVEDPSAGTWQPWVLDPTPNATALNTPAVRGTDNLNNMEQVTLDAPAAGTYTVHVDGFQVPQGPQTYHLLYYFVDSSITVTHPAGGESWAPNESEKIRWDAYGDFGTWTIEYSLDSGATWQLEASGVQGSRRYYDMTVPNSTITGDALVRVSRSGMSGISERTFSIIGVPNNLDVDASCPTYATLTWNNVSGATGYEISMLGNKYMDSIGTSATNSFQVTGISSTQEYWFSVKALGPEDAVGRRAVAVYKGPGVWNCTEPNDVAVIDIPQPGKGVAQACALGNDLQITIELENFSPNDITNIPVHYQLDGGGIVSETFTDTLFGYDTDTYTFATSQPLPATGTHTVTAWVGYAPDVHNANDTTVVDFELITGTSFNLPFTEDFESFASCGTQNNCEGTVCALSNGWINGDNGSTDDIDWRTDAGGTPSTGTGPSTDHNPGTTSGQYIYLEASACFEKYGSVVTPCLELPAGSNPEFSFWFHMNGADMGELHVDVYTDQGWEEDVTTPITSNWFNQWWERIIDLSPYEGQTVNLRFRGYTGPDYQSDIAIDDINLTMPVATDEALDGMRVKVYPNPSEGVFHVNLGDIQGQHAELRITDLQGRTVSSENIQAPSGYWNGDLLLTEQPAGIYLLHIRTDAGSVVKKLVRE